MGAVCQRPRASSEWARGELVGVGKLGRPKNVTHFGKVGEQLLNHFSIQLEAIVVHCTRQNVSNLIGHPSNVVDLQ